jgi:hypothetical protein
MCASLSTGKSHTLISNAQPVQHKEPFLKAVASKYASGVNALYRVENILTRESNLVAAGVRTVRVCANTLLFNCAKSDMHKN